MTTDHRDDAERRERPRPSDARRSGFMGNRGHVDPALPGGADPGREVPRRRNHDDYNDYPLDPRVPDPEGEDTAGLENKVRSGGASSGGA